MQLTKEIAIAEAEEKAIDEAVIDERKEIAIKQEPLNLSVSSFILIYLAFTTTFDSIISENVSSNKDRLYFIEKYTVGRANEIVRGFLPESPYTEARKLLNQRFGNLVHVTEAHKSR